MKSGWEKKGKRKNKEIVKQKKKNSESVTIVTPAEVTAFICGVSCMLRTRVRDQIQLKWII